MAKMEISKGGWCFHCEDETAWAMHEGWVFHTSAKHWRCGVCGSATEPWLYLPRSIAAKFVIPQDGRPADDDIVIEL